jgi:glucuronoarabinoxylan endo-1,4-beta-xylanase
MRIQGIAAVALVAALAGGAGGQTTITLNTATTYQTIEGLGGFACIKTALIRQGPFYIQAPMGPYYDSLAYDLGISMLRFEVTPSFWPSQASAYNPTADVFCGPLSQNYAAMRELAARGVNRFIFTVWSPPGWMKPSGSAAGPGEGAPGYGSTQSKLDPARYSDFARFLRDYLVTMRDSSGVPPYAVSIANEPRFTQTFNNCVWDPASYRDGIKVVGPVVKAALPDIRFFGTEAMFWDVNSWLSTVLGDATAASYITAVAGHYGGAGDYSSTFTQANSYGKTLWGSEEETDEVMTGLSAAMSQAGRLHFALAGGSASGWIGWTQAEFNGTDNASRVPHAIYFGAKHYFRFVRPGAQRISATGGGSLQVSAFKHTANSTVTVVIINTGGATSVNVAGSGLPAQFYRYLTDATHNCQNMGSGALSGIAIPGNSITTLYSADITATHEDVRRAASVVPARARVSSTVRVYSLDGRLIQASRVAAVPAGIHIETGVNGSARSVVSGR